mmetsp:Transcript_12592/g.28937  ORF Transcript_12592/g.28937 Transcript_12592/m.28937 type:complete len:209 (+) Transcript_12592:312-938(+)
MAVAPLADLHRQLHGLQQQGQESRRRHLRRRRRAGAQLDPEEAQVPRLGRKLAAKWHRRDHVGLRLHVPGEHGREAAQAEEEGGGRGGALHTHQEERQRARGDHGRQVQHRPQELPRAALPPGPGQTPDPGGPTGLRLEAPSFLPEQHPLRSFFLKRAAVPADLRQHHGPQLLVRGRRQPHASSSRGRTAGEGGDRHAGIFPLLPLAG